jgi:hypothetical protein
VIVEPVRAIAKNLKQRTHLRHGALRFETAQEPLPKAAVRQVDASRLSTPAGQSALIASAGFFGVRTRTAYLSGL